ncbi:Nif11-like leader peptide family RiPP precursor [Coleofasciculus chthonoplastes]|uniref:Nif11-like leader peptide family RiPP precursor n=1 Tax=Coleofasciculus chthonoplastes TaxID=64178 RepID=UPI00330172D4
MSKEAVINFFKILDKDPDLRERLTAIEDPEEVARIAESELGLNVTAEELSSALTAMQKYDDLPPEIELSDDELEAVAGGWFKNWVINTQKVDFKKVDFQVKGGQGKWSLEIKGGW